MFDTDKQVVINQYEAVLAGLNFCIDRYNIRHFQDHVAQLNGHLAARTGTAMPWFGSGWREIA